MSPPSVHKALVESSFRGGTNSRLLRLPSKKRQQALAWHVDVSVPDDSPSSTTAANDSVSASLTHSSCIVSSIVKRHFRNLDDA